MLEIVSLYWIKIFATFVVFVALVIFFIRSGSEQSSISGRTLVRNELDRLDDNYTVFCNVMIHLERGMSHIPYVVISPHGIFVVTCCSQVGKISGQKNDREWKVRGRGVDGTILNPLWENRKCINALEKKLNLQLPFIPLVVFTHAKLIDDFGSAAMGVNRLQKFFSEHTKVLMGQVDQQSAIAILEG